MDKQPSTAAKGCAFGVIILAVIGGGVIFAQLLKLVF